MRKKQISVYVTRFDELEQISNETKLKFGEIVDELVNSYGDKLCTKYNRIRLKVTEDDFRESPNIAETKSLYQKLMPWRFVEL